MPERLGLGNRIKQWMGIAIPAAPPARTPPPEPFKPQSPLVLPSALAQREYVSGSTDQLRSAFLQALPPYIDIVSKTHGEDIYEKMMLDSQVASCVTVLKVLAMAEGIVVRPAVDDRKDPRFRLASEIADFWVESFDNLPRSIDAIMFEMLDALYLGNRVAEQIYREPERWRQQTRMMLGDLKPKPRRSYAFVVDQFMNLLALVIAPPGYSTVRNAGYITMDANVRREDIIPREKFAILTHNPKNNDPRGSSALAPVYPSWWFKQLAMHDYSKFLGQFGSPSLWGTVGQDATALNKTDGLGNPVNDSSGNPIVLSPEEVMVQALEKLRAGSVSAFPFGASVNVVNTGGDGSAFRSAIIDVFDKQIAKGILLQTLATEEGQHMARAAAETHKEIMNLGVKHVRRWMGSMLEYDVMEPGTRYNWGDDVARALTPKISGREPDKDFAGDASAVATLFATGFVADNQVEALDERLGLPPREGGAPKPAQPPEPVGFAGDFDESKIVRAEGGRFGEKADAEKEKPEEKKETLDVKITKKPFGPSKAKLSREGVSIGYQSKAASEKIFGKNASKEQIATIAASLVGAPDNAKVSILGAGRGRIEVNIDHPSFTSTRILGVDKEGNKYIENESFFMKEGSQGKGLGTEVFGRQVEQASQNGFSYIKAHAAKDNPEAPDKPHNGYYTWPRLGYNAYIPEDLKTKMPPTLSKRKTVEGLMRSKEGRDWWKANGTDLENARFDLRDGSVSRRVLDAYLAEKGK